MNVQGYPMLIKIYKGKERILLNAIIEHAAGYSIDSDQFVNIQDIKNCAEIGRAVIQLVGYIQKSPLSIWLHFYEDGHYKVYSMTKSERRKGSYYDIIKKINLSSESTIEDIGKAVLDVMAASEKYYANRTVSKNISFKTIALPDGTNLTIEHPKDRHFTDLEDAHAAEIYQCYSYIPKENAEASAEFFLGMAAELDCSLEMENVRSTWEELYGKPDFFDIQETESGIFKLRFEMKNKDIHKISHFLQIEEDLLLECSMEVHSPNKRKKLDEDLTKLFAEFAGSCRLLTEL